MHPVKVPGRPKKFKAPVYTLQEVLQACEACAAFDKERKLKKFGYKDTPRGVAFAVVCVAAFAGLRLSEIRGLRWKNFDGESLVVEQSVWRTHVSGTKTEEAEAVVPVLPSLCHVLNEHKKTVNAKPDDFIFAGVRRGTPLNLHNLARRIIRPALEARNIPWKGFHAFRRGLASNLYELGVQPKIIQGILRHASIGTTLQWYVQIPPEETRAALQQLDTWFTDLVASNEPVTLES
jgi:integrase